MKITKRLRRASARNRRPVPRAITFPLPSCSWGVVTHFDHFSLKAPQTVTDLDAVVRVPIGALTVTFQ